MLYRSCQFVRWSLSQYAGLRCQFHRHKFFIKTFTTGEGHCPSIRLFFFVASPKWLLPPWTCTLCLPYTRQLILKLQSHTSPVSKLFIHTMCTADQTISSPAASNAPNWGSLISKAFRASKASRASKQSKDYLREEYEEAIKTWNKCEDEQEEVVNFFQETIRPLQNMKLNRAMCVGLGPLMKDNNSLTYPAGRVSMIQLVWFEFWIELLRSHGFKFGKGDSTCRSQYLTAI